LERALTTYDTERQYLSVLLKFKIAVKRYKYFTGAVGTARQFTVFDAGPTMTVHIGSLVSHKQWREVCRKILVKQYSRLPQRFSKPRRAPQLLIRALPMETGEETHRCFRHLQGNRTAIEQERGYQQTQDYR
jgi:hypothetical protein